MTIAEKIQVSADKTRFTLFKEGLFYKCYNEDAMMFTQKVRAYKVSSKFVKSVGANGFSVRCLKDCNTMHGSTTALVSFNANFKINVL